MAELNKRQTKQGGCLCGSIRFELTGPLRDIINCHCSKCRRFHGNFGAYTSIKEDNLKFIKQDSLKWYESITDETPDVYRGFCSNCGSSLFWHPRGKGYIAVAAGSLDTSTNLKTMGHVWISQMADFYTLNDNLPAFDQGWSK